MAVTETIKCLFKILLVLRIYLHTHKKLCLGKLELNRHTLSVEFGKEEKIVESFFALKKSLPIVQNRDPNTLKITHNNDDTEVEITYTNSVN